MKRIIYILLLLSLSSALHAKEKAPVPNVDVKFIIKGARLYCQLTNNTGKEITIERIDGSVTCITEFKTDGEEIDEDGPLEGKSVSNPQFGMVFQKPKKLPPKGTYKFSIPCYRPPEENQSVTVNVILRGKDFKISKSYKLKN